MSELKSCPFCGGEAEVKYDAVGSASIKCKNKCVVQCGTAFEHRIRTIEEAIAVWNRRHTPEPRQLTLDELRQMDGEPVWCEGQTRFGTDFKGWKVLRRDTNTTPYIRFTDQTNFGADDYCKTWFAYDRPPGGEGR